MAIGKVSTQNAFEVNMDTKFTGNLTINDKTIFDLIYPVGSIYMSVNSTNPTNLFGGTWVAWSQGRVVLVVIRDLRETSSDAGSSHLQCLPNLAFALNR